VCDDVYEKLLYDGAQHIGISALPGMREHTITINRLSKTYAMTGCRIGYIAAPADVVSQMLKLLHYSAMNIAPFSLWAAIVAPTTPELSSYTEMIYQTYDQRRRAGLAVTAEIGGLGALRPQGAFYLMLDVSQVCSDSVGFAYRLLEKARVAVVPGLGFGKSAERWSRSTFAIAEETLVQGIRLIA